MLSGCSSDSPTSTPTPTPLPVVTGDNVADARSRLAAQGVTASELAAACNYYESNGWSFTDAWNASIDDRVAATDLLHKVTYEEYSEALSSYLMGTPVPTDTLTKPDRVPFEEERDIIIERFTRLADVITDMSIVAEDIATPTDWALSVVASIEKPLAEWTEADHTSYEGAIIARKRQLLEPICMP